MSDIISQATLPGAGISVVTRPNDDPRPQYSVRLVVLVGNEIHVAQGISVEGASVRVDTPQAGSYLVKVGPWPDCAIEIEMINLAAQEPGRPTTKVAIP